jgi:hypothetical protein
MPAQEPLAFACPDDLQLALAPHLRGAFERLHLVYESMKIVALYRNDVAPLGELLHAMVRFAGCFAIASASLGGYLWFRGSALDLGLLSGKRLW